MTQRLNRGMAALICLGLGACGGHTTNAVLCTTGPSAPSGEACQYDRDYGYRFNPRKTDGTPKRTLVVLTFSGGGVRASALAYGTLLALRELNGEGNGTLLDEVDVISSVSGGSVTAGWYALHGQNGLGKGNDLEQFLYHDNMSALALRGLNPVSLGRYLVTARQRSDVLADYFASQLFGEATYHDVLAHYRDPSQPFVILNATDLGHETGFPFTQNRFDLICSDLNRYPLAAAVGASANFPLFFSAVGIQNYSDRCPVHGDRWTQDGPPQWIEYYRHVYDAVPKYDAAGSGATARRSNGLLQLRAARQALDYVAPASDDRVIHLLDGGLVDNLGIQSTFALEDDAVCLPGLFQRLAAPRPPAYQHFEEVLFIVVNARSRTPAAIDNTVTPPSLLSTLLGIIDTSLDSTILSTQNYLTAELYAISRWNPYASNRVVQREATPDELSPRGTCFREGSAFLRELVGEPNVTGKTGDDGKTAPDLNRAVNQRPRFGFRIVSIDFELIPSKPCRDRFWQLSTSWTLERQAIDDLIRLPRIMLKRSPELNEFYADLRRMREGRSRPFDDSAKASSQPENAGKAFNDPTSFPADFAGVCSS